MANNIQDLLIEADIIIDQVTDYFEDKMDADHDGENFVPNKEMTLSIRMEDLQLILKQIKKQIK